MISRRTFLKAAAVASAVLSFGTQVAGATEKTWRSLNLFNIHTGESIDVCYYTSGRYDYDALDRIHYLLRCHYTDTVKEIDIRVIDLLSDIKDFFGRSRQLKIISGYRSPEYNDHLRSLGRKVAEDSLHLRGLAIDFAIEGIGNDRVSQIAKSFASGGVGRYSEFVHIDAGRVRYW